MEKAKKRKRKTFTRADGKKVTEDLVRDATREDLKEAKPLEENGYKKELVEAVLYRAVLSLV